MAECLIARAMRGAQCDTDHIMQRAIVVAKIRPPVRKTGMKKTKINTNLLKNDVKSTELRNNITAKLLTNQRSSNNQNLPDVTEEWADFSKTLYDTTTETLGFLKKRHQDWFDDNDAAIAKLVFEKNSAHNNFLSKPTRANKSKWKELQARVQVLTREMKNSWWEKNAREIQQCADTGRVQAFYEGIKRVSGPTRSATCPIKDSEGTLLKDNSQILKRWAEYYCDLLNSAFPTDRSAIDELPQMATAYQMDELPTMSEIESAIASLKSGKAPGPDGIPGEVYRCLDEVALDRKSVV